MNKEWRLSSYGRSLVLKRLLDLADVVLPVMTLDFDSRCESLAGALVNGWSGEDQTGEPKRVHVTEDIRTRARIGEKVFRDMCVRHNLYPLWSEDLVTNHATILQRYGIDTTGLTFSDSRS